MLTGKLSASVQYLEGITISRVFFSLPNSYVHVLEVSSLLHVSVYTIRGVSQSRRLKNRCSASESNCYMFTYSEVAFIIFEILRDQNDDLDVGETSFSESHASRTRASIPSFNATRTRTSKYCLHGRNIAFFSSNLL